MRRAAVERLGAPFGPPRGGPLLIDGHVHLHAIHPLELALDSAVAGFARASGDARGHGVLWLVEASGEGAADRLRSIGGGPWRLDEGNPVEWTLNRDDGASLRLVRGRQVVTAEDVEVLIVGTAERQPDGVPLTQVLDAWVDRDVLLMLPWGLGKWSGHRGRAVDEAFDAFADRGLRLADTGARAAWIPTPGPFRRSAARGLPVFAGSDPFPFRGRYRSIGSMGFRPASVADDTSWPAVRRALLELRGPCHRFGRPMRTAEFLGLQVRMQVRKRLGGGR